MDLLNYIYHYHICNHWEQYLHIHYSHNTFQLDKDNPEDMYHSLHQHHKYHHHSRFLGGYQQHIHYSRNVGQLGKDNPEDMCHSLHQYLYYKFHRRRVLMVVVYKLITSNAFIVKSKHGITTYLGITKTVTLSKCC